MCFNMVCCSHVPSSTIVQCTKKLFVIHYVWDEVGYELCWHDLMNWKEILRMQGCGRGWENSFGYCYRCLFNIVITWSEGGRL